MADFKIAETDTFIKKRKQLKYDRVYSKITDYVYPILRMNPYYGQNIKKLKGEYKEALPAIVWQRAEDQDRPGEIELRS